MSFSERIGGALVALVVASIIGYNYYAPFHNFVNAFFWGIWVLIASLILFAVFYLLPLVALSFGVGKLWAGLSAPSHEAGPEKTSSYKGLIVIIPVTFLIAAFFPSFPQPTPFVKEQVAAPLIPEPPKPDPLSHDKQPHRFVI